MKINTAKLCLNRLFGSGLISHKIHRMLINDIKAILDKCDKASLYGWLQDTHMVMYDRKVELVQYCMVQHMDGLISKFNNISFYRKSDLFIELKSNLDNYFEKQGEYNIPGIQPYGYMYIHPFNVFVLQIELLHNHNECIVSIYVNETLDSRETFDYYYREAYRLGLTYNFVWREQVFRGSISNIRDLLRLIDITDNIDDYSKMKSICKRFV